MNSLFDLLRVDGTSCRIEAHHALPLEGFLHNRQGYGVSILIADKAFAVPLAAHTGNGLHNTSARSRRVDV